MEYFKYNLNIELPIVGCDFNTGGMSNEPNDCCYYSFYEKDLSRLKSLLGKRVILYSHDTETEVTACEGIIEPYREGWLAEPVTSFWFCGFRASPIDKTWYGGPQPAAWPKPGD